MFHRLADQAAAAIGSIFLVCIRDDDLISRLSKRCPVYICWLGMFQKTFPLPKNACMLSQVQHNQSYHASGLKWLCCGA